MLWIMVRRRRLEYLDRMSFNYHPHPHTTKLKWERGRLLVNVAVGTMSRSDSHFSTKAPMLEFHWRLEQLVEAGSRFFSMRAAQHASTALQCGLPTAS